MGSKFPELWEGIFSFDKFGTSREVTGQLKFTGYLGSIKLKILAGGSIDSPVQTL
jgi:hypothetical protein